MTTCTCNSTLFYRITTDTDYQLKRYFVCHECSLMYLMDDEIGALRIYETDIHWPDSPTFETGYNIQARIIWLKPKINLLDEMVNQ